MNLSLRMLSTSAFAGTQSITCLMQRLGLGAWSFLCSKRLKQETSPETKPTALDELRITKSPIQSNLQNLSRCLQQECNDSKGYQVGVPRYLDVTLRLARACRLRPEEAKPVRVTEMYAFCEKRAASSPCRIKPHPRGATNPHTSFRIAKDQHIAERRRKALNEIRTEETSSDSDCVPLGLYQTSRTKPSEFRRAAIAKVEQAQETDERGRETASTGGSE